MQTMLDEAIRILCFLIITLIFALAENHWMKVFSYMIQEDGMLDRLFGYRTMLDNLYGSESKFKRSIGDALGNCEMCTSFWQAVVWFVAYMLICRFVVDVWIDDFVTNRKWYILAFVNIAWFMAIHMLLAMFGFMALKKAKKDGV